MIDLDGLVIGPCLGVFGQPVVLQPAAGGPPVAITGVFDQEYLDLQPLSAAGAVGMPSNITSARPVLGLQLSQLAVLPVQGDQVTIVATGATFGVVEVRPDGHGWARLLLNEA